MMILQRYYIVMYNMMFVKDVLQDYTTLRNDIDSPLNLIKFHNIVWLEWRYIIWIKFQL